MSRYTKRIDLSSRGQLEAKSDREKASFLEPELSLPAATLESLPEALRTRVANAGWTSLMPVQSKAIPYLQDGRDMIVQSKTGSGKTGAFLLPLFDKLDASLKAPQALILSPTRELARQIFEAFQEMTGDSGLTGVVIYGGVKYAPQLQALEEGCQVVVGTPGRILDHLQRRTLVLDDISTFILDEADEMLSMGFLPDMREMKRYLPTPRQSCMFSATMPHRVRNLAKSFLDEPGFLSLSTGNVGVEEIRHKYYRLDAMQKDRTLVRLIELENPDSAIIFANTKREVEYVGTFLANYGYDAASISGDLSQAAREAVMKRIRDGNLRFLVATDVAARGIDISDLSHVIMYDVPQDQEYYIHRAGRTARAGKTGTALVLTTIETERQLLQTAHKYAIEMERAEVPTDEDVRSRVSERMTVTLESRFRDKTNLNRERLQRFIPMVEELAREEPELLAMLIDDLYHDTLHRPTDSDGQASGGDSSRGKGRRGNRRGR